MLVDTGVLPVAGVSVTVPAQDPAPPPGKGPEFGSASPVGLAVVLLLLIATAFLIKSMSSRIRRLPESFETEEQDVSADAADTPRDANPGRS